MDTEIENYFSVIWNWQAFSGTNIEPYLVLSLLEFNHKVSSKTTSWSYWTDDTRNELINSSHYYGLSFQIYNF